MRLQLDDPAYDRPAPNVRCDLCAYGTALEVGEIACHNSTTRFGVFAPGWWCEHWLDRSAPPRVIVDGWNPPDMKRLSS